MKSKFKSWVLALPAALCVAFALAGPAHAGRTCEAQKPTVQSVENGMKLAQKTRDALEAENAKSGARVVLLARAGQDLTKYNLRYSHLGFAYRTPEGVWRVVHKLNNCGTADAFIYRQGLGEFFMDDPWRYEAAYEVLSSAVQEKLLPMLEDPRRVIAMNTRDYSMVAYVWGRKYQQSNQWALETLAASQEATIRTREQAQAWLQFKGYEPTTLRLGPLTRLGGRMTKANIAFDDHPNDKRFSDRIETVTADSMFDWMPKAGIASGVSLVGL